MKFKLRDILIMLLLFSLISVVAIAKELDLKGDIISRLEFGIKEGEILKANNSLELDLSYYSTQSGLGRAVFKVSDLDEEKYELKKVFAELYFESTDLKIGKQRIAWGKADGINPTDNFNPENLRNPFNEENRIAVPAIRAKHYYRDWILDLVWVPQFTAPKFSKPGDRWSIIPFGNIKPVLPEKKIKNSEFGFRASKWTPEIDYSLSIFRGFCKQPYFPAKAITKNGKLIWNPEFYKVVALGGDFAKDFASFVLRGEGAYLIPDDKYDDLKDAYYQVVFGIDKDLTDNIYINTQYYREKENGKKATQILNFSTEYEITAFKNLELNGSYNIDDNDFLFNPVYNIEVMDSVSVSIGAYFFNGSEGSNYGRYGDDDYCYIEMKRSF